MNNCKECQIKEYDAKLKTANGNNINVLGLNKLKAIFRKMENGTKLKSLTLRQDSWFVLYPFKYSGKCFQQVGVSLVVLRPNQLKTIFDYMSVKTKLKSLHLESLNMESVDIKIFDSAFSNLVHLILNGLDLDINQLKDLAVNLDKSCKGSFQ